MERCDLAVIGGGMAGLVAAVTAARAGLSVEVFERQSAAGGRAASELHEGFCLNQGPHALYPGGGALEALEALGIRPGGAAPKAVGLAVHEGKLHTLPAGPVSLLSTSLLGASAKWEVARLMGSLGGADASRFRGQSVDQAVEALAQAPEARALLRALLRIPSYCEDTGRQCAEAAVGQLARSLQRGVFYVDGGWQAIVDALTREARSAGVRMRCGEAVQGLRPGGAGHEVQAASGAVEARAVLVTTGPRLAARLLGSAELRSFADRAAPLRAACLDVALSATPRPRARLLLGVDRPIFGSLQSETAKVAPPGGGVVHMMYYLREGESAGGPQRAELERALDGLQPGWRGLAVRQRWLPEMVVSHARIEAGQGVGARPGVAVPGQPTAFVAGDWVGGRGMLADASCASAREAAALICQRLAGRSGKVAA